MDQETNITLCCPSRGRPEYAKRMQNSAFATAANPNNIKVKFLEMDLKCSAKQTFIGRELHSIHSSNFRFRGY